MKKRTTVTATADDLDILRDEARRLGVSLNVVLRDLIAERAEQLQAARRPRLGVGRSGGAELSRQSAADEDSPAATPFRG